jgi:nitroimidazol reductase NimA-like FMN-containing flavoprotein (pyridoxamine 5'-phosphate oxidase superfamily)
MARREETTQYMERKTNDRPGTGVPLDQRGHMHRVKRLMQDDDARTFLQQQKVAHAATVDAAGWPYVIPLIYIYEGGEHLYVHTGDYGGHFQRNIESQPRMCIEVAAMGPVHRGRPFACNSALVYTSVIVFGTVRILSDSSRKAWFFDRVLEKYGESDWTFEPGYPHLHRIELYEQQIELITGKHSEGLYH